MKRLLCLLASFFSSAAIGCSHSVTELGIIGGTQNLPMPAFYAKDSEADGQLPRFAQIRVYHLLNNCSIPDCPIVWDVVVSIRHAPNEFIYGGFPGFGSQTIIAAQPLKPNNDYLLVTLPDEHGTPFGHGKLPFHVTNDGKVISK